MKTTQKVKGVGDQTSKTITVEVDRDQADRLVASYHRSDPKLQQAFAPLTVESIDVVPPIFEIRGLNKKYRGYHLSIDELDVPSGVVALLGVSGSGKSTLLQILASLDPCYSGTVRFVSDESASTMALRRRHFSFAFQTPNLLSNLTVEANVRLSRDLARISDGDTASVLQHFFTELRNDDQRNGKQDDVKKFGKRFPNALSVGQRQRVAAARAYSKGKCGSTVLFADEPTANLDPLSAARCFEQLCEWQREKPNRLLLLATHDLSLAHKADHIILLGFEGGNEHESQFGVIVDEPTEKCWPTIEELLTDGGPKIDQSSLPRLRKNDQGSVERRRSLLPVWRSFFNYFFRDISRGRDLLGTLARLAVVILLFFMLALCAVLLEGVPLVANKVLERDRLLRLVDVESTGQFPISPEKLNQLGQLTEEDGSISHDPVIDSGRQLLIGVSPKRELPLRFYREDGEQHPNWIDEVRIVYPEHPELPRGEALFAFWGIEELKRDSGVVVSPDLLKKLGYDVKQFEMWAADRSPKACLYAIEGGDWKLRIPVERVQKFPDDHVDLIVPALLSQKIQKLSEDVVEKRYKRFLLGRFANEEEAKAEASKLEPKIIEKLESLGAAKPTKFNVDGSLDFPGQFALWISTKSEKGFSKDEIVATAETLTLPFEFPGRILPGDAVENEPSPEANQATLFVADFNDVPAIIDHIESHRETLKLRVLNAKNREFVKTAQLAVSITKNGVLLVGSLFLVACLFGILSSFSTMLRRKVGEIAVLKAFGAGPLFILLRFVFETALVCTLGGFVAIWLTKSFVVSHLNDAVGRFFDLPVNAMSPVFALGASTTVLFIIIAVTALLMAIIAVPYLWKTPSTLLSLSE